MKNDNHNLVDLVPLLWENENCFGEKNRSWASQGQNMRYDYHTSSLASGVLPQKCQVIKFGKPGNNLANGPKPQNHPTTLVAGRCEASNSCVEIVGETTAHAACTADIAGINAGTWCGSNAWGVAMFGEEEAGFEIPGA